MLETTIDKFIFRVEEGLYYNDFGIWVALEDSSARVGLSDFAQQLNGDVAFANVVPVGTLVKFNEPFGNIETVKAILDLPSPVTGRITKVNPDLENSPELVNQDPYGKGWMAILVLDRWQEEKGALLDAGRYLEFVKRQAELEMKK